MSVAGFFTGVIGLAGLEVLLSSSRATTAVGGLAQGASAVTQRLISPDLGLIPNLHDASGPAWSSGTAVTTPLTDPAIPHRLGDVGPLTPGSLPQPVPRRPQAKQGTSTDSTAGRAPVVAKGAG